MVLATVVAFNTPARAQQGGAQSAPMTLTLVQALQYAVDHYPTVRAAVEQVNASTANVSVARGSYLPRFDWVWQTNRATTNNVFGQLLPQSVLPSISGPVLPSASGQSVWGSAVGGLLSWEPVDFGLRSATVREAAENVRAMEGLKRAARAERLPAIAITSGYQRLSFPSGFAPDFGSALENWTVGFSANVTVVMTVGAKSGAALNA